MENLLKELIDLEANLKEKNQKVGNDFRKFCRKICEISNLSKFFIGYLKDNWGNEQYSLYYNYEEDRVEKWKYYRYRCEEDVFESVYKVTIMRLPDLMKKVEKRIEKMIERRKKVLKDYGKLEKILEILK